ncbi:ClpXP adapter SpxH family protein [Metabacillus fastidiosus]|uniref:ClpXP adapter SpxH family protein n=1 Tax=Metabacillus fastidiosus TaxID=1458 RepID=UPI003D29756D
MQNYRGEKELAHFFSHCHNHPDKPIEIYMFVDPLCPECWALEPIIKKLQIEYGRLFSLKYIVSGKLATLNMTKKQRPEKLAHTWEKTGKRTGMSCDGKVWFNSPISTPYAASLAIKSAELQGKRAGARYLRKLQELLFIESVNVSSENVLINIAKNVQLDAEEFKKDLHSSSSAKALQCDLKITSEMDVHEIPTLAFFNQNVDEEGIKISGYYPYEVYVDVLREMLGTIPKPSQTPPLEAFIQYYKFVASSEIAAVYNLSIQEVEKEMKKLLLCKRVERIQAKHGTFWRFSDERSDK